MVLHPGTEPVLGHAVAGCDVDVVDPVFEQQVEYRVGLLLGGGEEGGCSEQGSGG
jgi:hypothetical protein